MKPNILIPIIAIILFFTNNPDSLSQSPNTVPSSITTAFRNGDAQQLSDYLNSTVELVIIDKEDTYSKTQAQTILKDFFSNHKPTQFSIVHNGGKEGAQYAICNLTTVNGMFRVYFLFKNLGSASFIHQLRIETEE